MNKTQARKAVKDWRRGPGKGISAFWMAHQDHQELKGIHKGKKRQFRTHRISPPHGSAQGSFRIWELLDKELEPVGFSLSVPDFWDCCRIADEGRNSNILIRTGTFNFKEKTMAVKKKAKSTIEQLAQDAERFMIEGRAANAKKDAASGSAEPVEGQPHKPFMGIVLKGKNGKWLYGDIKDEAKLEKQDGTFASAADASEACAKDHDIILNTAPAREIKPGQTRGGSWASLSHAVREGTAAKTSTKPDKPSLIDGVSLKKVCSEAGIDPKLARRILRSKGAKPGGRWEWKADDVPGVVKLLKEGAEALKNKKDTPKVEAKIETPTSEKLIESAKRTVKPGLQKKPGKVVKKSTKKPIAKKKSAKKGK